MQRVAIPALLTCLEHLAKRAFTNRAFHRDFAPVKLPAFRDSDLAFAYLNSSASFNQLRSVKQESRACY